MLDPTRTLYMFFPPESPGVVPSYSNERNSVVRRQDAHTRGESGCVWRAARNTWRQSWIFQSALLKGRVGVNVMGSQRFPNYVDFHSEKLKEYA